MTGASRTLVRRADTVARMDRRVGELTQGFSSYVETFTRSRLFTGPSLYFHWKTIRLLGAYPSPVEAIPHRDFAESLYATLTAWGMHRMGPGVAKLVDFDEMHESMVRQAPLIKEVQALTIWDTSPTEVEDVASRLWLIIDGLKVGVGQTKLVAGSKALHHMLPNVVPPIDRRYTLRFFYHHTNLYGGDEKAFREMYPRFATIARSRRRAIEAVLGTGMNSSATKVLDNAIVGYVLRNIDGRAIEGDSP